jgi:hypothetical protein
MEVLNMSDFSIFLLGFGFNLLVALIIVCLIHYPSTHDKRYVFTFMVFNTIIFFLVSLMANVEIGIGVGFGLFAIFRILRYRTDPIPVRETTYLFVIAALPVMNSAVSSGNVWPQLILANIAIIAILLFLEKGWGFHYESSKRIVYEKIELITPEHRDELLADLEARTGMKIKRLSIGRINFLRDTVDIKIFYDDPNDSWLNSASSESSALASLDDD